MTFPVFFPLKNLPGNLSDDHYKTFKGAGLLEAPVGSVTTCHSACFQTFCVIWFCEPTSDLRFVSARHFSTQRCAALRSRDSFVGSFSALNLIKRFWSNLVFWPTRRHHLELIFLDYSCALSQNSKLQRARAQRHISSFSNVNCCQTLYRPRAPCP